VKCGEIYCSACVMKRERELEWMWNGEREYENPIQDQK
jgi:hypothetical protein